MLRLGEGGFCVSCSHLMEIIHEWRQFLHVGSWQGENREPLICATSELNANYNSLKDVLIITNVA